MQVFSWNAGNLQRNTQLGTVNDLIATPFHMSVVQEAEAYCVQPQVFDARAIRSVSSRDRSTMINAGGSGFKIVKKHILKTILSVTGSVGLLTLTILLLTLIAHLSCGKSKKN